MKARIIYEVECPPVNCDREDFLKWLELNLYGPGACVTSDNPLFGEPLDFDTADFDNIEVIEGELRPVSNDRLELDRHL